MKIKKKQKQKQKQKQKTKKHTMSEQFQISIGNRRKCHLMLIESVQSTPMINPLKKYSKPCI